jgi:hypothetical protein
MLAVSISCVWRSWVGYLATKRTDWHRRRSLGFQARKDTGTLIIPLRIDTGFRGAVGAVRALAVGSADRLPELPDTPKLIQSGCQQCVATVRFALGSPSGVPQDIADKIKASADQALSDVYLQEVSAKVGFVVHNKRTSEEITNLIAEDRARWSKIIAAQKVSIQQTTADAAEP